MPTSSRTGGQRPLIALPQRFADSTSALRYGAVVTARALAEAVLRAGGEPFMMLPAEPEEAAARLARCDGLLLPGGGDLAPQLYSRQPTHHSVYDVDPAQDAFDLALTRHALTDLPQLPVLAVCRGLQAVNIVLGGTLRQHMDGTEGDHRHLVHPVSLTADSTAAQALGAGKAEVSCFHHQCVDRLGSGLVVTARAADGTPEGVELPSRTGWFTAVQWHPEDTAATDPTQQALFDALVRAAAEHTAGHVDPSG